MTEKLSVIDAIRTRAGAMVTDSIPLVRKLAGGIWQNPVTGAGTDRDKSQAMQITPGLMLTDTEKTILFHQDFMARRVVDKFPREALKKGFSFGAKAADPGLIDGVNSDLDRLDTVRQTLNAWIMARNYGGAVNVMGIDDGRPAEMPVDTTRIRSVDWLEMVDRRWVTPLTYETNTQARDYGLPATYLVSNPNGAGGQSRTIHTSRLLIFRGPQTTADVQQQLGSWDISIHDLVIQALAGFRDAWASSGALLGTAHQGVFKVKGFARMLMNDQTDELLTRLQLVDLYRSIMRSIVVDADGEDFEWKTASLAGSA
jgi:phage-related protein (TIGR01555 family)